MTIYHHPVAALSGESIDLNEFSGSALLIVNVASRCGNTPQYAGLQNLYETYRDRGFHVLGFPCNQFGGQEPGSEEDIAEFCSSTYQVTFPMFSKIEVNGPDRHPLYAELTQQQDRDGRAGDVQWNFEKFVISPDGEPVGRFRPPVEPADPALVEAITAQLPR